MAFSKLLMQSSFFRILERILHKPAGFLFGISGAYANAFLIGGIIGFPMGAKAVKETYINSHDFSDSKNFTDKSHISNKNQAERTLAFCNNCSISFVVSAVGIAVFNSTSAGFLIFFIQMISACITGIIIRFIFREKSKKNGKNGKNKKNAEPVKSAGELFASPVNQPQYKYTERANAYPTASLTETISESVDGILNICGIVLFFFIMINISVEYLKMTGLFNPVNLSYAKTMISGIFEVSSGIYSLADSVNFNTNIVYKLLLSSVILGWSGISVHFQIMYILKDIDLSLKPYFTGKIIHAIICILITVIAFKANLFTGLPQSGKFAETGADIYYQGYYSSYPVNLYEIAGFNGFKSYIIITAIVSAAVILSVFITALIFNFHEKYRQSAKSKNCKQSQSKNGIYKTKEF